MLCNTFDAGKPHVQFDERGVEIECMAGYSGTGNRKGRSRLWPVLHAPTPLLVSTHDGLGRCKQRCLKAIRLLNCQNHGLHHFIYALIGTFPNRSGPGPAFASGFGSLSTAGGFCECTSSASLENSGPLMDRTSKPPRLRVRIAAPQSLV